MTSTITERQTVEERFSALFDLLEGSTPNGNSAALKTIRQDAIAQFLRQGLPTRKTEAWKYTPIEKRFSKDHAVYYQQHTDTLTPDTIDAVRIPDLDAPIVVTLNGRFISALSSTEGLPGDVRLLELHAAADAEEDAFFAHFTRHADFHEDTLTALNTAFCRHGLFIHLPARVRLERPMYILHLLDAGPHSVVQPRLLVRADADSDATIVEHYHSLNDTDRFVNTVSEWTIDRQSHIRHYQIQDLNPSGTAVFNRYVHQETHSHFSTHTSVLNGGLIRNNLTIVPDAVECESHLLGIVHGKGSMHVDNHTLVDHRKPDCFSNELYKHILDDKSTGVFNGKVYVRPDAQKINAYQSNKCITLTEEARMYSKPELEIYADDVQCSHGATTGQLDADALFYLRSRGLNEQEARSLLLLAFARDVIDAIDVEAVRVFVDDRIRANL